jgi:membrane protease YdiL (CAAX protease family)
MPRNLYWALLSIGIFPFFINGYVNASIAKWPVAYWTFELLYWIVIPATVLACLIRFGRLQLSEIGLSSTILGRRSIGLVILICIVFCAIDFLVYYHAIRYLHTVLPNEGIFQYKSVIPEGGIRRMLVVIYLALSAGFVEEIYFRGLLFKACSFVPSATLKYFVLSPLLFALAHWESGPANTAAAYVVGVVTAGAFLAMRNLWPLIAGHIYTDYFWYA